MQFLKDTTNYMWPIFRLVNYNSNCFQNFAFTFGPDTFGPGSRALVPASIPFFWKGMKAIT